jgi:death-on-curing protein
VSESAWRWVAENVVYAVHDEQIAEHGGLAGVRDKALLLSALARPQHLEAYGNPDIAELAAAYAVGIARNHPFLDGNKRTAIVVAGGVFLPVAEGLLGDAELAAWFRTYMKAMEI